MKTTIVCIRIDMINMPKKVYSIHTLTFKLITSIQFHNLLKAVKRNDYKQKKILVYYHVDQREIHRVEESIKHAKELLVDSWQDKVFMIICPKNIPDRVLLQPYLDLKIIVLK